MPVKKEKRDKPQPQSSNICENTISQPRVNVTKITELGNSISFITMLDESNRPANYHVTMINSANKVEVPSKTSIHCFWCRHPFSNIPIGCPIRFVPAQVQNTYVSEITRDEYSIKTIVPDDLLENNIKQTTVQAELSYYETDGIFCSFACCLSFIDDNRRDSMYSESKSLLLKMYMDMFGSFPENIPKAHHWRMLREYGGSLSIESFRNLFGKVEYEPYLCLKNIPTKQVTHLFKEKIKL